MRAVVCRELRGPTPWSSPICPTPEPGACGVRIRVRAAGVNFADSLMLPGATRRSRPCPSRRASSSPGRSRRSAPAYAASRSGQRVLAVVDHGAFAEQAVARAEDVVLLPDDMDDVTAAGFAIAYGTAHGALRWRADLHAGETLRRPRCRRRRRPDRGRVRQGDRGGGDRDRAR